MVELEAHFGALKAKEREQGVIYEPSERQDIFFSWFLWKVGLVAQELAWTLEVLASLPASD